MLFSFFLVKVCRNPLPPAASRCLAKFKEASGTLLFPPILPCTEWLKIHSEQGLAERSSLLVSIALSYLFPDTVILSADALALRRARQAQRRAQQTPIQLSKEQKELVQILLGAHTRHVSTMFDQFVQFRVSTYRI